MTIDELKEQFLNYFVNYGGSRNTRQAYGFDLSKLIFYLNSKGITDVQSVDTQLIEDYLFGLCVSMSTKARRRSSTAAFFKYLYRKRYIQSDPAINLESIKVPVKSPEYLSQEQYSIFIKTVEKESTPYYKERDLMLVKLLIKSGLRRAELVGLNALDVDLSKLRLRVTRKGNREEYLIIHHELVEDLRKYLNSIKRSGDTPLFMSKRGKRLSASSVWHLIKTYSRKAGLNGNVTVHSLRHTFASALLSEAVPLPYIQALMGHRSPQTTSRYLHFQNSQLSEAFNKVSFEGR